MMRRPSIGSPSMLTSTPLLRCRPSTVELVPDGVTPGAVGTLRDCGRSVWKAALDALNRSEERRVGDECVSQCRSRWARYLEKKNMTVRHHQNIHTHKINN